MGSTPTKATMETKTVSDLRDIVFSVLSKNKISKVVVNIKNGSAVGVKDFEISNKLVNRTDVLNNLFLEPIPQYSDNFDLYDAIYDLCNRYLSNSNYVVRKATLFLQTNKKTVSIGLPYL